MLYNNLALKQINPLCIHVAFIPLPVDVIQENLLRILQLSLHETKQLFSCQWTFKLNNSSYSQMSCKFFERFQWRPKVQTAINGWRIFFLVQVFFNSMRKTLISKRTKTMHQWNAKLKMPSVYRIYNSFASNFEVFGLMVYWQLCSLLASRKDNIAKFAADSWWHWHWQWSVYYWYKSKKRQIQPKSIPLVAYEQQIWLCWFIILTYGSWILSTKTTVANGFVLFYFCLLFHITIQMNPSWNIHDILE